MSTNKYTSNNESTLAAVSNADGETPVYIYADPTSHALLTSTGTGSSASEVKVTDGTNIVNVLKSDGTAAGQNAELVAGTGMTTGTLTLNLASPSTAWFDMLNYAWVSVEVLTNTGVQLTFQTTGDAAQTNIRSMPLFDSQNTAAVGSTTSISAVATLHGPRTGRWFRVTSNASGALLSTIVITFHTMASALQSFGVQAAQQGTWTVGSNSATGSAIPANAFYVGASNGTNLTPIRTLVAGSNLASEILGAGIVAQLDDTSTSPVTEDRFGPVRMSVDRSLLISTQNSYAHIATSATTTVKSGSGTLKSITVNTLGTVASTTTVYDSTTGSGTVIAVINTLALAGPFPYDIQFTTGLTLVTTGTVAPDITVSYK